MTYTYIKFESRTMGEKARDLLLKKGINSSLKRNPNPDRKQGCNFALFVKGDVYKAFDILTRNDIKTLGVENYRDGL
ncbi:MAG: hypothetical protein ACI4GC_00465 [Acutalibacteraceae bacterium]